MDLFGERDFSIDNFINEFRGGAKSFLFIWEPEIKDSEGNLLALDTRKKRRYLVKSTGFPSSNVEEIIVEYQGLDFKMGGKRSYEDWNITLNVDADGMIRYELEEWMNAIHKVDDKNNQHFYRSRYETTQIFKILKGDGNFESPLLQVTLYNAWPKSISSIALDYSSTEFAQFDLTFSYQYHTIERPTITPGMMIDLSSFLDDVKTKFSGLIS